MIISSTYKHNGRRLTPINDIIMRTLNLTEENVLSIQYVYKNKHNFYILTLVSRGNYCPQCHTFSKKIHSYKIRNLNHAFLLKDDCTIKYKQRRYICPNCGTTFIEAAPFISNHPKLTKTTITKVLELLKDYNSTFSSVARQTNTSVTEVIQVFDEYVQIDRKPLSPVICIDEFYFSRHNDSKYACLLVNFKNGLILDVLDSRKKSSLREYFRSIPLEEREKVVYVSMDMYENYKDIASKYLPNATICIDSFHVIKMINDALDKIRIKVMNRYKTNKQSDEYYLLKNKNELLFRDSNKVDDQSFNYNHHFKRRLSDTQLLNMILSIDKELKEAYGLKEYYAVFNVMKKEKNELEEYLEEIIKDYTNSNIMLFNQIALTLKNWRKEIINSFGEYDGRRINNGPIEGRNKYIKILLNLANGYRNFKRFRNRVLYVFNKFDKPSDSPKETKLIKLPGIIRGNYKKKKLKSRQKNECILLHSFCIYHTLNLKVLSKRPHYFLKVIVHPPHDYLKCQSIPLLL